MDTIGKWVVTCCKCSIAGHYKTTAHIVLDGWEKNDAGQWHCPGCSEEGKN